MLTWFGGSQKQFVSLAEVDKRRENIVAQKVESPQDGAAKKKNDKLRTLGWHFKGTKGGRLAERIGGGVKGKQSQLCEVKEGSWKAKRTKGGG